MRDRKTVMVLVSVVMLGDGFPAGSVRRAADLGADVIAVDVGSTDSGPYDLGAAVAKTARAAVARDLRLSLTVARIYSEQEPGAMLPFLEAGRIRPLPPAGELAAATQYLTLKFSNPFISESGRHEASWNGGDVAADTESDLPPVPRPRDLC